MTHEHPTTTYAAVRMATGTKVHLRAAGSSTTLCGTWTGNTRQYAADTTVITCAACCRKMSHNFYAGEIAAQGFTRHDAPADMATTPEQQTRLAAARERLGTRECAHCGEPTFVVDMTYRAEAGSLCALCSRDYDNNTNN